MTADHDMLSKSALVKGGPMTYPAEPAAVVMPRTNDLLSGEVDLATTASIGPNQCQQFHTQLLNSRIDELLELQHYC